MYFLSTALMGEAFESNWTFRNYGDQQQFNTANGENQTSYGVVVAKSLLWPGAMALASPKVPKILRIFFQK